MLPIRSKRRWEEECVAPNSIADIVSGPLPVISRCGWPVPLVGGLVRNPSLNSRLNIGSGYRYLQYLFIMEGLHRSHDRIRRYALFACIENRMKPFTNG